MRYCILTDRLEDTDEPGRSLSKRRRRAGAEGSISLISVSRLRPRVPVFLLFIVFLLVLLPPVADAQDVDTLEQRVREWVLLRQEWSTANNEWKAQKELLDDELRMLTRKKEELAKSLADQQTKTTELEESFNTATDEKEKREAALDNLAQPLAQSESLLRSWKDKLPEFFLRYVAKGFDKLPSIEAESNEDQHAERLQLLFGLHGQLEQLNTVIHMERAILPDSTGQEREMEVIFFGMAQGFALSLDGTSAAVGRMTSKGLQWISRNDLAPSIKEALAFYKKEKPADFISLPLQIDEKEK